MRACIGVVPWEKRKVIINKTLHNWIIQELDADSMWEKTVPQEEAEMDLEFEAE